MIGVSDTTMTNRTGPKGDKGDDGAGVATLTPRIEELESSVVIKTTTELGFTHADVTMASQIINDAAWEAMKVLYMFKVLVLHVMGNTAGYNGFVWNGRTLPISIIGMTMDAGFKVTTDGTHVMSIAGIIDGLRCPNPVFGNLTFDGGLAENGYLQGAKPNSGVVGDVDWTYSSGLQLAAVKDFDVYGCTFKNVAYDGFGGAMQIEGGIVRDCTVNGCLDDGINIGGTRAASLRDNDSVTNVTVVNCEAWYVRNTAFHGSGGAHGCRFINNKAFRCGLKGIDFVHRDNYCDGLDITDLGQPNRLDPIFNDYFGGNLVMDGFHRSSAGGGSAASGIASLSVYGKSNNIYKNVRIFNMFDRDNREMVALDLRADVHVDSSFDVYLDNTMQDTTYYSSANVKPIHTGAANNNNFTNCHMKVRAVFAANNLGGRSDIHHGGKTNTIDIDVINAAPVSQPAMQIDGDELVILRATASGGGYVNLLGDLMDARRIKNKNTTPNAATVCKGLVDTGTGNKIELLELEDCALLPSDGMRIKGYIYKGSPDQRPKMIENSLGGHDVVIDHLHVEQEALAGGVTADSLISNRKSDGMIKMQTGYSKLTGSQYYKSDDALAKNFKMLAGALELHQTFVFEVIAAGEMFFGPLEIKSHLAAGSEMTVKSNESVMAGLVIKRALANASKVLALSGDSCGVKMTGVGVGVGNLVADTGLNNELELLEL